MSESVSRSLAVLADWWPVLGQMYRDDPTAELAAGWRAVLSPLPESEVLHEAILVAIRQSPEFRPKPGRMFEIAETIRIRRQQMPGHNRPKYLDAPKAEPRGARSGHSGNFGGVAREAYRKGERMKDLAELEGIVERACIITNTTLSELLYGGHHRALVDVRRRVAKEAREAGYSLPEIGRARELQNLHPRCSAQPQQSAAHALGG
jgi:hypothetical protein